MTVYSNLIDGELVAASNGATLASIEPATGKVWAQIPRSTKPDVDLAVEAARSAFGSWANMLAKDRARHIRAMAAMVEEHVPELAELESRDNGRALRETLAGDLPACVEMLYYFAGAADKLNGDTVGVGPGSLNFTRREPLGVVGIVIPWNAPMSLVCAKVGAALAAGNTVVVKPAEQAACSVLRWGELLTRLSLPPGVVNIVSGLGEDAGQCLVEHPGVQRITFTGSTDTARRITADSASTLKQLHFELGGKSPNIVFADADLDSAIPGVAGGIFTAGAGQVCVAGSRILVESSVYDEVVEGLVAAAEAVNLGDPTDQGTAMGPIISDEQLERVRSFIDLGTEEGKLLTGGRSEGTVLFDEDSRHADGYWVEPTLFEVDGNSHRICQEEIFGPVGVIMRFEDDAEAVRLANDSRYGLAAGVWTRDLRRAHRMVNELQVGSVWVNSFRRIHWALPFGGVKDSGYGYDSGMESVLENTRLKTAFIDLT